MTQKPSPEKLVDTLLQTIDPSGIADESLRHTVEILLNVIEQLQAKTLITRARKSKTSRRK